ncbi:hypothetical protein HNR60_003290 [Rhodopseudomonas rhenobacensis]|uniref:Uncharacterized protein n=1 Tax=Rhodopseudomonas rhenobacensis TaxID=87461 RepID=A0A7W7Z623_9BRAD|nr:hypothetical protein [Rhodopseudomonas rhenobacensis]MBB5048523.1 hypothetical protein [Rhodopseudomonas rhenobacensis]
MAETPQAYSSGTVPRGVLAGAPPVEKYTQSQVAEALMSIASSILRKDVDRTTALNMAGVLSVYVNNPANKDFAPGGNLTGNSAFTALVTEKVPLLALAEKDPAAAMAAAKAELARANVSGAPLSEATRAALGLSRIADGRGNANGTGGSGERVSSAGYTRELSGTAYTEKIGVSARDVEGLEKRFGHDAVALATQQIQDMGLRGRQNLAYAAEFKDVAGALHDGDIARARSIAAQEPDPQKKQRAEQFIKNWEEAQAKRIDSATKGMPKAEADEFKKVYREHENHPANPEIQKKFDAMKEKYKDNPKIMRELTRHDHDEAQVTAIKNNKSSESTAPQDRNTHEKQENAKTAARVEDKSKIAAATQAQVQKKKAAALAALD